MRPMIKRLVVFAWVVACLPLGRGLGAESSGTPASQAAAGASFGRVESGKALWAQSCKVCHESPRMLAMLGVKKPDSLKPQMLSKMEANTVADAVHKGKGKMKPLPKLTDAQIADIDAYLVSLSSGANPTQTK